MRWLEPLVQLAGGVQLLIAGANLLLPQRLSYRENLARVSPIIRQIFTVHSVFIVLVLLIFAGTSLAFAPELTSGEGLGRYLSAAMAFLWLLRLVLHLHYYDRDLRRQYPVHDRAFLLAIASLATVYSVAAVGF